MNPDNEKHNHKLISIEPISENDILSYQYDGSEVQEKPLNPNEEFMQLTSKIDFTKYYNEIMDYSYQDLNCLDDESEVRDSTQTNLTEKLRKHLNSSLDEINALIDILTVSKDNQYIQLKKVVRDPISNEESINPFFNYIAGKKVALGECANILLSSKARLEATLALPNDKTNSSERGSFYHDLGVLRREWRIKWHQNILVCDIGLRSCGSVLPLMTNCQIIEKKARNDAEAESVDDKSHLSNLKIVLMNNQEGEPILRVKFHNSCVDSTFTQVSHLPAARELKSQISKLNRAQKLMFYTEILSTLCWEAPHLGITAIMDETRITIMLEDGNKLEIELLILPEKHWFEYNATNNAKISDFNTNSLLGNCLVVLMSDLLREKHRLHIAGQLSPANPVVGKVQVSSLQRYRGVNWYRSCDSRLSNNKFEPSYHRLFILPCLLHCIVAKKARTKVLEILDDFAANLPAGMCLKSHINSDQSVLNTSVSVVISSAHLNNIQYDYIIQITVLIPFTVKLTIISDKLKHSITCKSVESQLLIGFFQNQIVNCKLDIIRRQATEKYKWSIMDMRLTYSRKDIGIRTSSNHVVDDDTRLILLSRDCSTLLKICVNLAMVETTKEGHDTIQRPRYLIQVQFSKVVEMTAKLWQPIDIDLLQKRLIKSDLEVLELVLAGFH